MFKFGKKSLERMEGVNGDLIIIFNEAIRTSVVDFGIPKYGGLRTAEEQSKLYADGKSNCDGYHTISNHQKGLALDFYAYVNGKASWDKIHLAMVASHILGTANLMRHSGEIDIELKWGGEFGSDNFHGWDYPHIEAIL